MEKYKIIRSCRKTIHFSIDMDLSILVKAPMETPIDEIELLLTKYTVWLEKQKTIMRECIERRRNNAMPDERIKELKQEARNILPPKVEHFSKIMNVTPTGVKITSATTQWASCSARNSLCFSYRIMLLPDDIIDYIVVHELSHIRIKSHDEMFYKEFSKYMPDYQERRSRLRELQKELRF